MLTTPLAAKAPVADLLFVHGAAHGAWCWQATIAALAASGARARAIDLPGCGDDPTPAAQATLDACAQAILAAMDGPTIVIGHSAGGYPITAAAERDPSRIAGLIYLCAYVPRAGASLAQMRRAGPSQPLEGGFRLTPDRAAFTFDPALAADRFFHDCPPDVAAMALSRLTPQPLAPQDAALPSTARAEALPRHYIRCTRDRAIPPEYQTTMAQGLAVTDLATGHSPFLSAPDKLAASILRIAANFARRG